MANGTDLRLVVIADVVRRALSLNGFERLVAIYPDLDGALAAGGERSLQCAAADTAALLERRAGLAGHPGRIDYPTEIKRWRILADQAAQMAQRWEHQP